MYRIIVLREGEEPTIFKTTTNEPYSEKKHLERAISFKGCYCELDRISENYKSIWWQCAAPI